MRWEIVLALVIAPFVGSFLGTLVLRLPAGESVVGSRSKCPRCGRTLGPLELIPFVSWLAQRGKCRGCSARIGPFYPLMELGALAVVAWAALLTEGLVFLLSCLLGSLLLALAVMDWRTLRLADVLNLLLLVTGFGAAYLIDRANLLDHVIGAAVGLLLLVLLAAAYRWARGREGLGLGDAKLMGAGGAWLGWQGVGSALLIGSVAALCGVLLLRIAGRPITSDAQLPYGSFLALGIWLVWLYGPLVPV